MSMEEIKSWVYDHMNVRNRLVYNDNFGAKYQFENGDTYETRERENGLWEKTVKTFINGEMVNETVYRWHNFGWQPV